MKQTVVQSGTVRCTRKEIQQKKAKLRPLFLCPPHDTLSSTHIIIAPFVVLVFGFYVDGKLGQEGALEWIENTQQREIDLNSDHLVR